MIFFSCWATYIQIFFGNIQNIVTTTVTNSTGVEPVSYIYIIKPTGCQNNPGRVFPLDASASIPVLVQSKLPKIILVVRFWTNCISSRFCWVMSIWLAHWGWDKITAISQTKFSNALYWMKSYEFRLRFHWSLFLRFELIIFQQWFK